MNQAIYRVALLLGEVLGVAFVGSASALDDPLAEVDSASPMG